MSQTIRRALGILVLAILAVAAWEYSTADSILHRIGYRVETVLDAEPEQTSDSSKVPPDTPDSFDDELEWFQQVEATL